MYVIDYLRIPATNLHTIGLIGKADSVTLKWVYGLRQIQYKVQNFTISVIMVLRNFVLLMVQMLKSRL
jgi:hypothetical protein